MDPGISASRTIAVLVLGYLNLVVLLKVQSKVKEILGNRNEGFRRVGRVRFLAKIREELKRFFG